MTNETQELNHPWLVAVWPGMGNVAINAGFYLMSKLAMHLESEMEARELFEIGHVEVKNGIIRSGRLPRSRFFLWKDPKGERDLVVFLGEAQPPAGVHAYCRRIVEHARKLGVERIFTFAAMATQMQLDHKSRVFGAATAAKSLEECKRQALDVLMEAEISGLNGVLLGVAAERGLEGICLLGEMPHLFAQLPFPKASLAVLEVFGRMAGIEIDLDDLRHEATAMGEKLKTLIARIGEAVRPQQDGDADGGGELEPFGEPLEPEEKEPSALAPEDARHIEELFEQAEKDRSQAYRLKQELDRLNVFSEYEDRFLDLFQQPDGDEHGGERADPAA